MGIFFPGGPALNPGLPRAPGGLPCVKVRPGFVGWRGRAAGMRRCSHAAAQRALQVSRGEADRARDHTEHPGRCKAHADRVPLPQNHLLWALEVRRAWCLPWGIEGEVGLMMPSSQAGSAARSVGNAGPAHRPPPFVAVWNSLPGSAQ